MYGGRGVDNGEFLVWGSGVLGAFWEGFGGYVGFLGWGSGGGVGGGYGWGDGGWVWGAVAFGEWRHISSGPYERCRVRDDQIGQLVVVAVCVDCGDS